MINWIDSRGETKARQTLDADLFVLDDLFMAKKSPKKGPTNQLPRTVDGELLESGIDRI